MRAELQQRIDAVDPGAYSAVLLGYALCGNGLDGLVARTLPLVAPRPTTASRCCSAAAGATRSTSTGTRRLLSLHRMAGARATLEQPAGAGCELAELIHRYGEDNGRYLYEELNRYSRHTRN